MRMCSIASGSSGNCVYIGDDNTHILVDAGVSAKRIEDGLRILSLTGKDLSGILVTHEHTDHISGLGVMARRYKIPLYMTGGTADALLRCSSIGRLDEGLIREIREDESFSVGTLQVEAFQIPHDAAQPVAYRFAGGKSKAAVATDLGKATEYIAEHLLGLDAVLLESNHDVNMLQVGRYPYQLKLRIMGDRGHLSNENAGKLLSRIVHDNLKYVFLGHLSKDNNYEELALETVKNEVTGGDNPYRASDFNIQVASRDHISQVADF